MRTPSVMTVGLRAVVLALVAFVPACGSSGSGGASGNLGASGVDRSKKLITLSDAEKGMLCDWMVGKAGSYGNPGSCDRTQTGTSFPFLTYDDQAACIADSRGPTDTGCQATVADMEACISALPACATLSDAASKPACAAIDGC
ncbi:MAG TPA: hypothetical protein VIF57_10290 [Polyangia bacterium]|jgi:hypothetical protein